MKKNYRLLRLFIGDYQDAGIAEIHLHGSGVLENDLAMNYLL